MPTNRISKDHQPWTPSHVYAYLCECFRRGLGELKLTEHEFNAARNGYVSRARHKYFSCRMMVSRNQSKKNKREHPKRRYVRKERTSILDGSPTRILELVDWLHQVEFAWIVLQGEHRALKAEEESDGAIERYLKNQYGYLPQVKRDALLGDLKSHPYTLGCDEIAEQLGIQSESLAQMLSPSQRKLAGKPQWLARLEQDMAKTSGGLIPKDLPPERKRRLISLIWKGKIKVDR